MDLKDNKIYKSLKDKDSKFIFNIDKLFLIVNDLLPKINKVFANYTEHGCDHSLRVLNYISELIDDDALKTLSELEMTVIIYVSLLHDIGMVVKDEELNQLSDASKNQLGMKYGVIKEQFKDESLAKQEFYRTVHGIRAKDRIEEIDRSIFEIPDSKGVYFIDEVSNICCSHCESHDWIKSNLSDKFVKSDFEINSQYIAVLLRLGDILDIDTQRAPEYIFDLFELNDYGTNEWRQHFTIDNTSKIELDTKTNKKYIQFYGKSKDPNIHRKILSYFDWINQELEGSLNLCENFNELKFSLNVKNKVVNKIETEGFSVSDFRLQLNYKAVTQLLMGEKLYGDKKYGLREILQNSIDACQLMKEIYDNDRNRIGMVYQPTIAIVLDKEKGTVTIRDNGIGMSEEVLKNYFLTVGTSYYVSNNFKYQGYNYQPIGNYGIGFLACFMLSETVHLKTRYYKESSTIELELNKDTEYMSMINSNYLSDSGTDIILDYDSFMSVFNNEKINIVDFIQENFLIDKVAIKLIEIQLENIITSAIENLDHLKTDECKGLNFELGDYLQGITFEGYIKFDEMFDEFEGIKLNETSNIFTFLLNSQANKYELANIDENRLKQYIKQDYIEMASILIVDDELTNEFKRDYEYFNDERNAYEMLFDMSDYEEYINIFLGSDGVQSTDLCYKRTFGYNMINNSDFIIDNESAVYNYEDFCKQFNSNMNLHSNIRLNKIHLVSNDEFEDILLYYVYEDSVIKNDNFKVYYRNNFRRVKIFNKNVFLKSEKLTIPFFINGFTIESTLINILSKNVIPNVERSKISTTESYANVNYAIGRAIHLYILDNIELTQNYKILLKTFIDTKYGEITEFNKK